MDCIETQGKTVDQAVEAALNELGVGKEDVDIEVLDEGSGGLFGIGGSPATVRVTVAREETPVSVSDEETDDAGPDTVSGVGEVVEALETILDLMNVDAAIDIEESDEDIVISIESDDAAVLIGRRGKCLNSLQFILNRIVSRERRHEKRVVVDVEGYRKRRRESLTDMAERMADKANRSGREVRLQPLDPRDRRTVHVALRDYPGVDTYSVGEGLYRSVIVSPEGESRPGGRRSSGR